MRRILAAFFLILVASGLVAMLTRSPEAQTHTFPALDTNNVFTGMNTFAGITSPYTPKSVVGDYGAKCDARTVTDWTQSSGSTTATSATAAFTSADAGKLVGINNGTAGAPNALLSTTIATFVNSTTVTTTSAPTRAIVPAAGGGDGWAAIGTDDSTALGNAIGAGRWVTLPANQKCTYKTTMYVNSISNFILSGFGSASELIFLPVAPLGTPTNLAPIFIQSNFTGRRQIANAIAIGATSFVLSASGDGTDLVANDYLVIGDGDPNASSPGASEKVNYDMVQVRSVAGTTVNVQSPFRTAFTTSRTFNAGNQNGLGFYRIIPSQTAANIRLLNFRITYPLAATATLNECGIYTYAVRNVEMGGLHINSAKPICTYDSKQLDIHDIFVEGVARVTPEFASTVDSVISNWHQSSVGTALDSTTQPQVGGLSVDFGSAFNQFNNFTIDAVGNAGIGCTVAHDNVFNGWNIGYVRNATAAPQGVNSTGCYNNKFDNMVLSAADAAGTAFNFSNTSGFGTNVNDASNIIGDNFVGSTWATYSSLAASSDSLADMNGNAAAPAMRFSGGNRQICQVVGSSCFTDILDTNSQWIWRLTGSFTTRMSISNTDFQLAVPASPTVAGAQDLGKTASPWGNLWLGTAATNNAKFQPATMTAARTVEVLDSDFALGRGMVTSTYTNATTTASNITGLSFAVLANRNYTMDCQLYYQGSAGTAGLDITITGPASPTSVLYSYEEDPTTTTVQNGVAVTFGTKLIGNAAVTATTNLPAHVTMGLRNGANAGTVQVQGSATGAGTVTIQVGSACTIQ